MGMGLQLHLLHGQIFIHSYIMDSILNLVSGYRLNDEAAYLFLNKK